MYINGHRSFDSENVIEKPYRSVRNVLRFFGDFPFSRRNINPVENNSIFI